MRDRIHKMRVENGEEPYTGEELSMCDPDKDDGGYVYAEKLYPNLKNFLKRMNAKINVWLLGIRKNDGT